MTNLTVENVYTRHKAKALAKQHFWKLMGMLLIVFGIVYGLMIGGSALLAFATGEEIQVSTTATSVSANIDGTGNIAFTVGIIVLILALMLLSSGLMLGLTNAFLSLCRGEDDVSIGQVFSRMKHGLKGLGLNLWTSLKIFLWALPCYVLIFVLVLAAASTMYDASAAVSEGMLTFMTILPFGAILMVFALIVPAALRYMLSAYILADKPDTGVFDCVRQSKAIMKGHKWQAFKLAVPVVLTAYVLFLVAGVALGAASAILGTTTAMVSILSIVTVVVMLGIMLFYIIRLYLCYCIFYLNRLKETQPAEDPAAEPSAE